MNVFYKQSGIFVVMESPPFSRIENITERENTVDEISEVLNLYLPPILIVLGSVCNFLVIKVMRSVYFRFLSTSFYICVNALIDTFSLLVLLSAHWINANFPWTVYRGKHGHYLCKFFNFFGWMSSDYGIVLTTVMTFERGFAIMLPLKSSKWCTVSRAKYMSGMLLVFSIVKDIHFLFTSGLTPKRQRYKLCEIDSENENMIIFWKYVWPWIHNCFLLVTFSIIIVSNIVILRHVQRSLRVQREANVYERYNNHGRAESRAHTHAQIQKRSRIRQILIMLLADSATIVICTVPFSIYTSVTSNVQVKTNSPEESTDDLIYSASFYLLYINRCANFFLYCVSGSRFRNALRFSFCPRNYQSASDVSIRFHPPFLETNSNHHDSVSHNAMEMISNHRFSDNINGE